MYIKKTTGYVCSINDDRTSGHIAKDTGSSYRVTKIGYVCRDDDERAPVAKKVIPAKPKNEKPAPVTPEPAPVTVPEKPVTAKPVPEKPKPAPKPAAPNLEGYTHYQIITEAGACSVCESHNGAIYPISFADRPDYLPPFHPNCRCRVVGYVIGHDFPNIADSFEFDWTKDGLPSTEHVTPEFMLAVIEVAHRLQVSHDDLMAIMAYESWFNPQAVNHLGATGLIQITQVNEERLGITREELRKLTAIEQLEYVYLYYLPYVGRMGNVGDMYMATLWPLAIGQPDDYVLWTLGGVNDYQYRQNRGLDINNDGMVTRGEAIQRVLQRREIFKR